MRVWAHSSQRSTWPPSAAVRHVSIAVMTRRWPELMNSAIAHAQQPIMMAEAMKHAIVAGRLAYLAGRMPKKLYASASSPLDGLIK